MEENTEILLEKYKITLDFLKFEATILWQIFSAFFVAHAIIIGFVVSSLTENDSCKVNTQLILFAGIVGVILSVFWLLTFYSNSQWYYFRMKQAKSDETNLDKDLSKDDWSLLNNEAEKFANNIPLKNKLGGYGIIVTFLLIYIITICFASFRMSYI